MEFRRGGNRWGTHRVLEPVGALPQAALRLDVSLPPFDNEILIRVKSLQIDSASFQQLKTEGIELGERIQQIVRERGKMHNPVTNSGGVFLGEVVAIGEHHPLRERLKIGDRIVSLVSLTLTPLLLEKVQGVDEETGQVTIEGFAILFESGMAAKIPTDFSDKVVMAALDVCGAPAQTKRLVRAGQKVLVIGLGKAGKSAACQAELSGATVFGVDANPESVLWCQKNLKGSSTRGHFEVMMATDPLKIFSWVEEMTRGALVDVVLHAVTVEGTEMSGILPCRDGGTVLFFGMCTSFGRAVLGAEGVGKDVSLLMGSGYVPGHDELMMNLLRKHTGLRKWFEEKYG